MAPIPDYAGLPVEAANSNVETIFEHVYGTDTGGLAEHDRQACHVIRELNADEDDPEYQPMFEIVFRDGFRTIAFAEEIGR